MTNILIIITLVIALIAVIVGYRSSKLQSNMNEQLEDRQEFYSSNCDLGLINIIGVEINDDKKVNVWTVKYRSAIFSVSNNNMNLSEYLTDVQKEKLLSM